MNAIVFDQVTLALGGREVLSAVSFTVQACEFVAVLGPNGAGKTTLLRAVLGLVRPSAGRIAVLGEQPGRSNRAVGYMPQQRVTAADSRLTGRAFVAAVVRGRRLGLPLLGREGAREVDWALERVGASALAHRPLASLSGGERQRLLLAQSLIGRPRLLLLDEPLISLDLNAQQQVVALAQSLQRELGISVLFSAHDLNPLLPVLDRVMYMGSGAVALGTADQVITGPVLSRLYGAPIEVVAVGGRIFVMAARGPAEPPHHPAAAVRHAVF